MHPHYTTTWGWGGHGGKSMSESRHCTQETQCVHSPNGRTKQDVMMLIAAKTVVLLFTSRFSQHPLPVISITIGGLHWSPSYPRNLGDGSHGWTSNTEGPATPYAALQRLPLVVTKNLENNDPHKYTWKSFGLPFIPSWTDTNCHFVEAKFWLHKM